MQQFASKNSLVRDNFGCLFLVLWQKLTASVLVSNLNQDPERKRPLALDCCAFLILVGNELEDGETFDV